MKNENIPKKKYRKEDIQKFIVREKGQGPTNLSTTYKEYLYGDKSKYAKNQNS